MSNYKNLLNDLYTNVVNKNNSVKKKVIIKKKVSPKIVIVKKKSVSPKIENKIEDNEKLTFHDLIDIDAIKYLNTFVKNQHKDKEQLWIDKYKPTNEKELVGNNVEIKKINNWLNNYSQNNEVTPKCLLISGPPGVGKSTIINVLCNKYKFNVHNLDLSEKHKNEKITNLIKKSITHYHLGFNNVNKSIIILDDIDFLSNCNKNNLQDIINIIQPEKKKRGRKPKPKPTIDTFIKKEPSNFPPIVCVINTNNLKKIKKIEEYSLHVRLNNLTDLELLDITNKIYKDVNFNLQLNCKMLIIEKSQGDLSRLIQILNEFYVKYKNVDVNMEITKVFLESIKKKHVDIQLYQALDSLLEDYENLSFNEKLLQSEIDKNLMPLMIDENCFDFFDSYDDIHHIDKILNNISDGDIFSNEIHTQNNWFLQYYCNVISIILPSYIIHHNRTVKNKVNINFTKMLGKLSSSSSKIKNMKLIQYNIHSLSDRSDFIYFRQILLNLLSNEDTIEQGLQLLKSYKFKDIDILDPILKIIEIDTDNINCKNYSKIFTYKYKNMLRKKFD